MIFRTKSLLVIITVAILATSIPYADAAAWYDSDWTYAKSITIDSAQVDATLTNFPLLVNYTSSDVGTNAQADCDDILFVDSTNVTKYPHEIENCDLTTNDWFTAWVNIPSISSSVDTDLFVYYGNSTVTSQENVTGTWNSNYKSVHHLHDDFLDSTSNNVDGTNNGSTDAADEHIADSQSFDGINDEINNGDNSAVDFEYNVPFSMTTWALIDDDGTNRVIAAKQNNVANFYTGWLAFVDSSDKWFISIRAHSLTQNELRTISTNAVTLGTYSKLDFTYNGNQTEQGIKLYQDGVELAMTYVGRSISSSILNTAQYTIGNRDTSSGLWMDGKLDEVRTNDSELSADWIDAEYNNQKAASTFLTIGAQGTEATGTSFTRNLTDELGLEDDGVGVMIGLVIATTDEMGLEDSVEVVRDITVSITDELGLEDSVIVSGSLNIAITDEMGLEDSVDVAVSAIVVTVTDEMGLEDSVEYDIVQQVFNAIKLYLAPPTSDRLGGIFAQSCAGGEYVSGIDTTGTIICTALP